MKKHIKFLIVIGLLSCTGCFKKVSPPQTEAERAGVQDAAWEEPMVDVIDVPPGLDPEGIYYRPQHQEIVEVRQGKWKVKK